VSHLSGRDAATDAEARAPAELILGASSIEGDVVPNPLRNVELDEVLDIGVEVASAICSSRRPARASLGPRGRRNTS